MSFKFIGLIVYFVALHLNTICRGQNTPPVVGGDTSESIAPNTLPTSQTNSNQGTTPQQNTTALPSNTTETTTWQPATLQPTTLQPTIPSHQCPAANDPNQFVFVASSASCSEYYFCFNGQSIKKQCLGNLRFNALTQICDLPENVNCQLPEIPSREQCRGNIVYYYPYPDNCNYYYHCQNGYLMIDQCPLGLGWDYLQKKCLSIKEAKCYELI